MRKYVLVLLIVALGMTACNTLQTVKKMKSKRASVSEWRTADKTVLFLPMVHIANPEFYQSVRKVVEGKKAEGFTVYYEGTKMKQIDEARKAALLGKPYLKYYHGLQHTDSICQVIYKKKLTKFVGFIPDSVAYRRYIPESGFFAGMVAQPSRKELGLDHQDKNIDVGDNQLVDKYEELFGEIMLEESDFTVTSNSVYPKSLKLPKDRVKSVLIDFRNEHLAQYIHHSTDKKILVLFGMGHLKGTFEQLQSLDGRWRKL